MNENYNQEMVFDTASWMWMTREEYIEMKKAERN